MQSIKNHLSLVVALLSILCSIQVYIIVERAIDAYKVNLTNTYSIVVVSKKSIENNTILALNPLIQTATELAPDAIIKRLNTNMNNKNIELLKLSLPI